MHSSVLLAALIPAVAADLPFGKVFAARKSLSTAKPIPTPQVNRQAVASSIISVLNDRHGTPHTTARPRTTTVPGANGKAAGGASTTTKKHTTKKHTTKKHTTKRHTTRRSTKKHSKRDGTCANQVYPFNYASTPNTPQGFLTDLYLTGTSTSAKPPAGYSQNFTAQYGSLFAPNYINYYQQSSYNVSACAAICDSVSSCQGFNIYFERDPTLDPATACPNPTAAVSVRCALWGVNVNSGQAQNLGEYRNNFLLVIQGSNGYNKNPVPASVTGYASPSALAAAVDPSTIPASSAVQYLGYTFSAAGYDPNACAQYCASTTAANKAAAVASGSNNYNACNWFNAFLVTYNSTSQGMYCQAFTGDASAYATQYAQTVNGVNYGLTYSYGYGLSAPDSGVVSTVVSSATSVVQSVASSAATAASSVVSSAAGGVAGVVSSVAAVVPVAASSSTTPATTPATTQVATTSKAVTYASYTTTSINSGTGTSVLTSTITPASTNGVATVQLIYPTPVSTCGNSGSSAISWAAYQGVVTTVAGLSTFDPTIYKTRTPLYSGTSNYIGLYVDALSSTLGTATIYGNAGKSATSLVIDHKFYMFANQPGTYTITVPYADDIAFAWVGVKAISGWSRANADVNQLLGNTLSLSSYSFSVVMNTGDYRPIRLMYSNTVGVAELDFTITAPDGTKYASNTAQTNTGSIGPQIVQFPCNSTNGAAFPAWGSET